MAKAKSDLVIIRTHKATFTVERASSGMHWALVTNKLKGTDFAHIAGQLGITYEDLGKVVAIVDRKPAEITDLCKKLGVEYRDNFGAAASAGK